MSDFNVTIDPASDLFVKGMTDGYNGYTPTHEGDENYEAGYAAGESQWESDREAEAQEDMAFDNAFYEYDYEDYEPSPYDGTYSEM